MGRYVSAAIYYGVPVEEEGEMPWETDGADEEDDVEQWWMSQHGYSVVSPSPFNEAGNWREDLGEEERERMYAAWKQEKDNWRNANPMPVRIEYVGVSDYATKFLCVPGSPEVNSHGRQKRFRPADLDSRPFMAAVKPFLAFIRDHEIPTDGELGLYQTASYG